ncbi:MAG: choice-of-anchor D domain-containing protein [Deltaproteobacteria bacterium]|nr:choice-of-anchor D domain-containing protein [Deltaproteobacteria bacterium]
MKNLTIVVVSCLSLLPGCSDGAAPGGLDGAAEDILADATAPDSEQTEPGLVTDLLDLEPKRLLLGKVAWKAGLTGTVRLHNVAGVPVTIGVVEVIDNETGEFRLKAHPTFTPSQASPAPATLAAGESIALGVDFRNDIGGIGEVSATFRVEILAPVAGTVTAELLASRVTGERCIATLTPDGYDYGFLEPPATASHTFQLANSGDGVCEVIRILADTCYSGVVCKDGVPSDAFTLSGELQPGDLLGPGETTTFSATFAPPAPSGEPPQWQWYALLHAKLWAPGTADPVDTAPRDSPANLAGQTALGVLGVKPLVVDFGKVGLHTPRLRVVQVIAGGPPPSTATAVELTGCSDAFGLSLPDPLPFTLSGGAVADVTVSFTPEATGLAECALRVESALGEEFSVKLRGVGAVGALSVEPATVDFGEVPLDCQAMRAARIRSIGPVADTVQAITLENCAEGFALPSLPTLPLTLGAGQHRDVAIAFAPQAAGLQECQLHVVSALGEEFTIPVRGSGIALGDGSGPVIVEDSDVGVGAAEAVDMLFVIDDSGSMGEEQGNLASNFPKILEYALVSAVDFQIGITTTDVDEAGGALRGTPEVITPSSASAFLASAAVGTAGSGVEQGLEAAALSLAGPFGKYLRPRVPLVLLFISDEEDQSPSAVDEYLAAYRAAKGGIATLVTAHAIVGPSPDGCVSAVGNAEPGARYEQIAAATGGATASICSPDFSDALAGFAQGVLTPKFKFDLSSPAKSGTVKVSINGEPCPDGWEVTGPPGVQVVTFAPDSKCLPAEGDSLVFSYELDACYLFEAAGGDGP